MQQGDRLIGEKPVFAEGCPSGTLLTYSLISLLTGQKPRVGLSNPINLFPYQPINLGYY